MFATAGDGANMPGSGLGIRVARRMGGAAMAAARRDEVLL